MRLCLVAVIPKLSSTIIVDDIHQIEYDGKKEKLSLLAKKILEAALESKNIQSLKAHMNLFRQTKALLQCT